MNRKPYFRRPRAAPARRSPRGFVTRLVHYITRPILLVGVTGVALAVFSTAANAAAPMPLAEPASIEVVVNNIRAWLVGILVAVATLFLTIGGLRLMWANGDPGEAEKGKAALKSAAMGYGLAMLAPLIVKIVGKWVA